MGLTVIKRVILCAIINSILSLNKAACDESISPESSLRKQVKNLVQELQKSNDVVKRLTDSLGALSRQVIAKQCVHVYLFNAR